MKEKIGIIGLSDLGKRLAVQIASSGFSVVAFDKLPIKLSEFKFGIDPALKVDRNNNEEIEIANDAKTVLAKSKIVHWAIPSSSLPKLPDDLREDTIVILHDSVMNNSETAISSRKDVHNFQIAHCLMNNQKRVFIADDSSIVFNHFRDIGLEPKRITPRAHDQLLAVSQGILAALLDFGIKSELELAATKGDLTPSGEEFYALLRHRGLNWTPNTLSSILKNPALREVMKRIEKID